jgi:acetoin utilization deacetylase AcuC-like enzyme
MIIYNPHIPASLLEFGIQIPIHDNRTTQTFEALQAHPEIGPNLHRWHCDRIHQWLTRRDLLRVHSTAYVDDLYSDQLEKIITSTYELIDPDGNSYRYDPDKATRPLTDLFQRTLHKASGSAQCAQTALSDGFCYYFSGGMHHAHPDHGSGFCMINDIVIAARKMQAEQGIGRVWIIDTDAHKGDGTAAATAGDDSIITLSIHMENGWPLDGPPMLADGREHPAYAPSDIDIPIASGQEQIYLNRLEQGLKTLASSSPADLAIVVSGADPWEMDELPSTSGLNLTMEQLRDRDLMVYGFLKNHQVPAAFLMAGGYGKEVWKVFSQFLTWVLPKEGRSR